MQTEIWKDIPNFELYQVSSLGRIRNKVTGFIRKNVNSFGLYETIILFNNGKQRLFLVHRLVAKVFIPNPENKKEVNHIDGNKKNNRVENLEWTTRQENALHSVRNGLQTKEQLAKAVKCMNKATRKVVLQIKDKKVIARYNGLRQACRENNFSHGLISECVSGKRKSAYGCQWKYERKI